jgi:hypothetical protein
LDEITLYGQVAEIFGREANSLRKKLNRCREAKLANDRITA